jgi:hypothetical protein
VFINANKFKKNPVEVLSFVTKDTFYDTKHVLALMDHRQAFIEVKMYFK